MKEGRIFEYTIEHISIFRHLYEILSNVLHELEVVHYQPDKPVDNEKQDSDTESEKEKESDNESDDSGKDSNSD